MQTALSQQQNLTQQQRLTPMQVQYVQMLEMTGPELERRIDEALDEMPALERADAGHDDQTFGETAEELQRADYGSDEDVPDYRLSARNASPDDAAPSYQIAQDSDTLPEMLRRQLSEHDLTPLEKLVAEYIIGNLDSNGYLHRSPQSISDDVAMAYGVEVTATDVKRVIDLIRTLEPAGVGATDLRDCLLLQVDRLPRSVDTIMAHTILADHFDAFAKKHYDTLSNAMGIDRGSLRDAVDLIVRLNPKPGNVAADSAMESRAKQIVPEFEVTVEGEEITLTLLSNSPDLCISETFAADPAVTPGNRRESEAATFVRTRRDEAATFIKTLQMRQQTLYDVMKAIVDIQRDFFLTGDESLLRPMILRDISERTGYGLSVISRATASKYVLCPTGVYPLKFFFNENPVTDRNDTDNPTTLHRVNDAIRRLIAAEDKRNPLSDESLTELLAAEGLTLARRTVAKYRERLGYPVGRLRKTL